ncbi:MAG TPA: MMPL family transporter, partial [Acidimicrobiales bacterium]|nr:MMPL family transporter [Acidimicrobiales bacterium]
MDTGPIADVRPSLTAVPLSRGADSDPLEEYRLFAALGRFTVRYRWPIIVAWVIVTVILVLFLPSLSSVEKSSNSDFLPSSSASVKAGELAAPLQAKHNAQATYVAATNGRSLSAADTASIDRVERAIRTVPRVTSVIDQGMAADGRAREATVEFGGRQPATNKDTARAVAQVRAEFRSPGTPADLVMHLTGGVAQSVDQQNQSGQTQTLTEVLSLLFILA